MAGKLLRSLIFSFTLIAALGVQAAEQIYTLEFFKTDDRTEATEQALIISGVAKVPCRVVAMAGTFFLRCGSNTTNSKLQTELQRLRSLGLDKVNLILTDDDSDSVLQNYQPIDVGSETQAYLTTMARAKLSFQYQTQADAKKEPDLLRQAKQLQELDQGNKLVGQGWVAYRQNKFSDAIEIFKMAATMETVKLPALFGLSLSYFNDANYQDSLESFRTLLEADYETETVLPLYLQSALELGKFDIVRNHYRKLPTTQQAQWLEKLEVIEMEKAFKAISYRTSLAKLNRFVQQNQRFVKKCEPVSVWETVGKKLVALKANNQAVRLYMQLWDACNVQGVRVGILYQLNKVSPLEQQIAMLNSELAKNIDKDYRRQLNDYYYNSMMAKAGKLPPGSNEAGAIFDKIQRPYNVYTRYKLAKAWWYYQRDDFKQAMADFAWLWHKRDSKEGLKGMLFAMMKLGKLDQALEILQHNQLPEMKGLLYKEKLAQAKIPSEESFELAHWILQQEPEYPPALSALGWHALDKQQWTLARTYFLRWQQLDPDDKGAMIGLLQSYTKQEQFDDAFALAAQLDEPGEYNWQYNVRFEKALKLFNEKDYANAEPMFADLRAKKPQDRDLQTLHSWSLFHQGKYKKSAKQFLALYQGRQESTVAQGYMSSIDKLDKPGKKKAFVSQLAISDNPENRVLAADHYVTEENYIRAAFTDPSQGKYYTGVDNTEVWVDYNYWHKNGIHGISALDIKEMQIGASFVWDPASRLYLTVNLQEVDANMRAVSPFLGADYTYGQIPPEFPGADLTAISTKEKIWYPFIRYRREDTWDLDMGVGLSPLNAQLTSKLVWFFTAEQANSSLSVYRRPMTESQLSYLGIKDPYSTKRWGRVLETGVRYQHSDSLDDAFWISTSAEYNRYAGSNVIGNQGGKVEMLVGSSFSADSMDVSGGLIGSVSGFQRNSVFYSYGHGGYFSPQWMWQGGLFSRFESKKHVVDWWEIDLSIGYFRWRAEPQERYPIGLFKQPDPGGTGNGLSYGIRGEKHWLLGDNFEIGIAGHLARSPGYEQWRAGIIFRYFFKDHNYLMAKHRVIRPWAH